jgi:hypothetical protein
MGYNILYQVGIGSIQDRQQVLGIWYDTFATMLEGRWMILALERKGNCRAVTPKKGEARLDDSLSRIFFTYEECF